MTDLNIPVSRRTRDQHARWKKRVIVTLMPGDVISFRLERSTRNFVLPIHRLYDQAELATAKAFASAP